MAVKSHDFKKVIVTVNAIPISGFADADDAVSIEFDEDAWEKVVGADGEVSRVFRNHKGGQVTIRLNPTSSSNGTLNSFRVIDELTGLAPVSIMVRDALSLGQQYFIRSAWVMRHPGQSYGRGMTAKEWVYDCAEIDVTDAGSL